ncbi:hypothetical protein [Streptomyces sp. NRRL S-378]|uniref:hypothetical protein n=1 Tax=Streptomyces sp. NRRL S-378 TaxID=1463904 RepID=UPI00131BE8E8|nr:hypothetical protein [Streptomyces sp. NRRL S-378]
MSDDRGAIGDLQFGSDVEAWSGQVGDEEADVGEGHPVLLGAGVLDGGPSARWSGSGHGTVT